MPDLCDKLGVNLLMNSEDMSFHFKFVDVINETCKAFLDDGNGDVDEDKFVQWWNMDIEKLMHKDDKPPEPKEATQAK
jgi:hypothetical protein